MNREKNPLKFDKKNRLKIDKTCQKREENPVNNRKTIVKHEKKLSITETNGLKNREKYCVKIMSMVS